MQTEPVKTPPPAKGLRLGAVLVSGAINLIGALLVIFVMPAYASDDRMASAWVLVQFLSGVWAGVLGANSPFLHGLVAGLPALVLGLLVAERAARRSSSWCTWFVAPIRRIARRGTDALHAPPRTALGSVAAPASLRRTSPRSPRLAASMTALACSKPYLPEITILLGSPGTIL